MRSTLETNTGLFNGLTGRIKNYFIFLKNDLKDNKASYLFLAPFWLIFFIFTILPVFIAIFLSFTYYNMLEPPQWVGWHNYLRLFLDDDVFLIAIQNTFVFAIVTGPVSYIASLLIAWMVNEFKPRIRAFLTFLFYAPVLSGQAFFLWTIVFSGDAYGYANSFLLYWGIISEPVQWFQDPSYIMPIAIICVLWGSLGTAFLAFIGGLQGIDVTLYEAGAVDGIRNRWQELWYITLPQIAPHMLFGAIMTVTQSFLAAEQLISLVGFPSTDYAARTIVTHLLDFGNIRFEMGYAATIAVVLFAAMVGLNILIQKYLGKLKGDA
ncbi:carbohydrate ABC transporter permease [Natronospora cellulosivora (SeqCode)]